MRTANGFRMACLALGLALVAVGCAGPDGTPAATGVRGGTLRVLTAEPDVHAGHGRHTYGRDRARLRPDPVQLQPRGAARAEDRPGPRHRQRPPSSRPTSAPTPSPCAPGSATPPRSTARSPPKTSSPPSSGSTRQGEPLARAAVRGSHRRRRSVRCRKGQPHLGPGRPRRPHPHITLDQPAGDFLSILTLPCFAPVPGEYAASYAVGANYGGHVVGTGPYTPTTYDPGRLIVLDRNPNWDPATDPLRKAWVDRIQVKLGRQHRVDPAGHRAGGRPTCR